MPTIVCEFESKKANSGMSTYAYALTNSTVFVVTTTVLKIVPLVGTRLQVDFSKI